MADTGTENTNAKYANVYNTSTTPKSLKINKVDMKTPAKPKKKLSQKVKDGETEVFARLDTANTILETLPSAIDAVHDIINTRQFTFAASPMQLILQLLYTMGVNDEEIIDWLLDFLITSLPAIEIGLKGIMLARIKEIVSCSSDPRIPKKLRKKINSYYFDSDIIERGIDIPVESIDPKGILSKSPFNVDDGAQYYFGVMTAKAISGAIEMKGSTDYVASAKIPVYQLVRAEDFNAFLWFVIHKGRFPSPTSVSIDATNLKLNVANSDLEYKIDTSGDGGTTLLSEMVVNPQYGDGKKVDAMTLGQTFTMSGTPNMISMCFSKKTGYDEKEGEYTVSDILLPVSSDWKSVNWYKNEDIKRTLGLTNNKSNWTQKTYNKGDKGLCNLQYLTPTDKKSYDSIPTQTLRLTILPKPYVFTSPESLFYETDGSNKIPVYTKILFNEYGEPDKNGRFSLPTDKLTSSGLPYVHNDKLKITAEDLYNYVSEHMEDLTSEWKQVYNAIVDGNYNVLTGKSSMNLEVLRQIITKATIAGSADDRAKVLNAIDEAKKAKIKTEMDECTEGGVIKFKVGEDSDDCVLNVNINNNTYYLSDSNGARNKDFSKHLVECYDGLTVYEFNYDYIMSQKLFDPVVVCCQLLANATNGMDTSSFTLGVDITKDNSDYSYGASSQRISEIVKNIIDTDDEELSDCFFRFSNQNFVDMLEESEEKRFNRLPYVNGSKKIDLSEANAILATASSDMTKEEYKTILKRAIEVTMANLTDDSNEIAETDKSSIRLDFVTNMLSQLASALIDSILSPKVLLMIALNKELMGNDYKTFSAEELLTAMKGVIVALIRDLLDLILQKLLDYVISLIIPVVTQLTLKIETERYNNYKSLLNSLLRLFNSLSMTYSLGSSTIKDILRKYGKNTKKISNYDLPTVLDDVNYADILIDETDEINNSEPETPQNC